MVEDYNNENQNNNNNSGLDDLSDVKDRFKDNLGSNYANKVNTANQAAKNSAEHLASGADALGAFNSANQGTGDAAKDAGSEAGKEAAKEAGKETVKETTKEVAKEAGKEAAQAAASGGTSLIKTAVKIIAKKTAGEIASITQKGNIDSDYKAARTIFFFLLPLIFVIFLIFFGIFFFKETVGAVKNYSGKSFDVEIEGGLNGNIENGFAEDEEVRKYYTMQEEEIAPFKDAVDVYINGNNDGKGLKNALHDAVTIECKNIVENLDSNLLRIGFGEFLSRLVYGYDRQKSLDFFYELPWPYDLNIDGHPTVRDVCNGQAPQYNDVNFLEMLTILCQNENYDWENCKYTDFNEFIRTKRAQNLYYELDVKYVLEYYYTVSKEVPDELNGGTYYVEREEGPFDGDEVYDTIEECVAALDSKPVIYIDGHEATAKGFYIRTKLKPFGLRELYLMAEVNPTDYHRDWDHHTYSQLLDRTEKLTHTYLRKDADIANVYYQDKRTEESTIYEDLMAKYGEATGRSAWCYIDNPFNLRDYELTYEIPPEILETMIDFENLPEGSNTLANFLDYFYHNQCDIQNLNGQTGLCNFTSYMMIALYYNNITMTDQQLAALASQNCQSNGFFYKQGDILSQYHINKGADVHSNLPETIANSIDNGHPLVLHCKGYWVDYNTNEALHGKPGNDTGHFMVVYGYDSNGIKVADPGMRANNSRTISWESLAMPNDIYVREITYNQ